MENKVQSLQLLIDLLEKQRKLHISIADLNGALTAPLTQIRFESIIHSKNFCNIAKSTETGYRSCLKCKEASVARAMRERRPFLGQCFYGLYEAVIPVISDNAVIAVVYVGNAVIDEARVRERIYRNCERTGVAAEALLHELSGAEREIAEQELFAIGELVADYLKRLYELSTVRVEEKNWIVALMKRYANESGQVAVSLVDFAVSHRKNAQYIGRIFKKETGMSFNQYCNELRLERAEARLTGSDERIIDIALDCGFQNVPYFNRLFLKKYGASPRAYRKMRAAKSFDS